MSTLTAGQRRSWAHEDPTPGQLKLLEQLQREMTITIAPWPMSRLEAHLEIDAALALKAERLAPAQ